jgi:hypothetical protein
MAKRADVPWTRWEIATIVSLFVFSMVLATYMLSVKSWMFVAIYWAIWILFFSLGRFMVCRHCDYIGRPCPTLCMGMLAGRLFTRSDKKDFTEIRMWTFFLDVSFIVSAMVFPIIVYGCLFFHEGLTAVDRSLSAVYLVIGILVLVFHSRACKRCEAGGCPLR